jgi:outer membrane protein
MMTKKTLLVLGAMLAVAPVVAQTPLPLPTPPRPAAARPAPVPFPADAKVAFIDIQTIFNESALGKQGVARLKTLSDQLMAGLNGMSKEIQGLSEKIASQQNLATPQTLLAWSKDLSRKQREAQFAQQEAQVQLEQLQQELLADFRTKVQPVVETIRAERGLILVLTIESDSTGVSIIAAHPGANLSSEVVARLDGAPKG